MTLSKCWLLNYSLKKAHIILSFTVKSPNGWKHIFSVMLTLYPPDQESVDELLFLLQISRPVSLDMSIELIFQTVAVVFRVQFANLKQHKSQWIIYNNKSETQQESTTGKLKPKKHLPPLSILKVVRVWHPIPLLSKNNLLLQR